MAKTVRKKSLICSFLGFLMTCVSSRMILWEIGLMQASNSQISRPCMSIDDVVLGIPATASTTTSADASATSQTDPTAPALPPTKPLLVFHLGPPKTATTSLQTDLTKYASVLKEDNYLYLGRYYNPYKTESDGRYFLNRTSDPIADEAHSMLHQDRCNRIQAKCVQQFKKMLAPHAAAGTNILLSDEAFGMKWKKPTYYQAIHETLSDDWQVVMVAAYRHYYDWMPSLLFQRHRMDRRATTKDSWPSDKGRAVQLVFPTQLHKFPRRAPSQSSTSHLVKNINGLMPLRIFDLHDNSTSTRTNFMCNALPAAPKACALSRGKDKRNEKGTVMNTKDAVMNNKEGAPLHLFYDILATAAADAGLVDTSRYTRGEVRHAVHYFQESILQKSVMDLDLHCPDKDQQEAYLGQSLEHLRTVYGGDSLTANQVSAHKESFEARLKSRAWCWPDTDTLFGRLEWKDFFVEEFPSGEKQAE